MNECFSYPSVDAFCVYVTVSDPMPVLCDSQDVPSTLAPAAGHIHFFSVRVHDDDDAVSIALGARDVNAEMTRSIAKGADKLQIAWTNVSIYESFSPTLGADSDKLTYLRHFYLFFLESENR